MTAKKKTFLLAAAALVLLAILLPLLSLRPAAAVSEGDKQKVQEQIQKNKQSIGSMQSEIEKLKEQTSDAILVKEKLDKQVSAMQDNIDLTSQLISQYQSSIQNKIIEISEKQKETDRQLEGIKQQLRMSYEGGSSNFLEILFSSSSLKELMTRTERLRSLVTYQESQMKDLEEETAYLKELKAKLEDELAETEVLKRDQQMNKKELEAKVAEAEKAVSNLNKSTKQKEAEQKKYEQADKELEEKLKAIEAELKRQAEAGLASGSYIWPVPTSWNHISSPFGWRNDPFTGVKKFHNGIDIPASTGTDVYASNNGTVVAAEYDSSNGYYVMLSHGNGITTLYKHNSKICVKVGQVVKKGQVIAKAGSTGRSTGSHVHFEIRIDGSRVNPLDKSNRGKAYVVKP